MHWCTARSSLQGRQADLIFLLRDHRLGNFFLSHSSFPTSPYEWSRPYLGINEYTLLWRNGHITWSFARKQLSVSSSHIFSQNAVILTWPSHVHATMQWLVITVKVVLTRHHSTDSHEEDAIPSPIRRLHASFCTSVILCALTTMRFMYYQNNVPWPYNCSSSTLARTGALS